MLGISSSPQLVLIGHLTSSSDYLFIPYWTKSKYIFGGFGPIYYTDEYIAYRYRHHVTIAYRYRHHVTLNCSPAGPSSFQDFPQQHPCLWQNKLYWHCNCLLNALFVERRVILGHNVSQSAGVGACSD